MSRVTSKRQVTLPKAIADRFQIRPGDEIEWIAAGDGIRVELGGRGRKVLDVKERLRLFDESTRRLRRKKWKGKEPAGRGWTREELYTRGSPR
jgi:AbrB family looped-hinge helix DNA binding protein